VSTETAIGVACGALTGAGLLIVGLYRRSKVQASQDWPQVTGAITTAEVTKESDGESTQYVVYVSYEYRVNGQRCIGTRIRFGKRGYVRKKRAQAELERYSVNSTVMVYFNPEKPEEAVLVRESPDSMTLIVSGIGVMGIVVAGWLYSARN